MTLTRTLWSLSVLTRRPPSPDITSDVMMLQKCPQQQLRALLLLLLLAPSRRAAVPLLHPIFTP